MNRQLTDCGRRHLVREERWRDRLREETPGTADCGRASRARYVKGCRCDACRAASAAYERERTRAMAYGRPSGLVDAEPVRRRVRELMAAGYTYAELGKLAGVSRTTLHGLMVAHWRTGRPVKRCSRELKDKVFSIRGQRRLTAGQKVDAGWMAGWLSSYREAGVTAAEMARRIGVDRQVVDALLHGRRSRVRASTLHAFVLAKPGLDRLAGRGRR